MKVDSGSALDGATILANADRIGPLLREHAAEVEAARRLTEPVVNALRSTGVFRMAMPAAWGGPEVDICRQIEIVETLSRADASAGWCAQIGADSGYYSANIDQAAARSLYPDLDAVTAGWLTPAGTLEVCDGGYRLSGRWSFGSGVTHADVIVGGARVTENGSPRLLADGTPERRIAMLPAAQWDVLDTWRPLGLTGSGSHDYTITDTFVPAENTWVHGRSYRSGPLYSWRGMVVVNFVGVPLGTALDACDVATSILDAKVLVPEMIPARDAPRVRAAVARAQAMVGAARSYVYDTVSTFWSVIVAGDEPSIRQRAHLAGLLVHTVSECRTAVRLLVDTVGSVAIQDECSLGRQMRDLDTIAQHTLGKSRMWEWAGAMYFGQNSPSPLL
ncbi:acyl-CoA dehydrogenase family protein [Pseudonocardia alaniniphila]|uniref:Acyl-CoA dehydrogenase family protein n=1 Tax=Pseudonocardia alaniniphila TaxID=75291 RepID=A0ABS9TUL5_9PSEU|nr:acyl-CoA dehydrogenase family protein [Pseudonocardia alaniniphila]MCH6171921.1 acyl-CoA dehydrogenase family protein [Pseudonocardia alaniniphila]